MAANPPLQHKTSTAASMRQLMEEAEEGEDGGMLESATHLSRREVLERRSKRLKQLRSIYRHYYWVLMDQLKSKYRQYYWHYGKSPFLHHHNTTTTKTTRLPPPPASPSSSSAANFVKNEAQEDHVLQVGKEDEDEDGGVRKCRAGGCKSKAMPFTPFCHPHILSDSLQSLYLPCSFLLKFSQGKPVLCGKPTLRSTVPSLCPSHFQRAESYLARALRKEGVPVSSSSNKVSPKFHLIVTEFVCHIQNRRRSVLQQNHSQH